MSITRMTRDGSTDATGLGLALFSAATFGTSGTFADSLMQAGWTPAAVVTARITLAAVFLTGPAVMSLRGRWSSVRGALPAILAFGVIAVAGCQLCFFNAVQRLDVGVALLLEYLGILFVVAWMWFRQGQQPRRMTVIGGVAALVGLVLVLNPSAGRHRPDRCDVGSLRGEWAGVLLRHVLEVRRRHPAARALVGRDGHRRGDLDRRRPGPYRAVPGLDPQRRPAPPLDQLARPGDRLVPGRGRDRLRRRHRRGPATGREGRLVRRADRGAVRGA